MGEVFHGDVLGNVAKARYVLINEYDDPLAFSDIVRDDSILGYKVKDLLDRVMVPKQQDLFGKNSAMKLIEVAKEWFESKRDWSKKAPCLCITTN